jgi:hypothetical protein
MRMSMRIGSTTSQAYLQRKQLQNEVNYYLGCLNEITDSNDPAYRALLPIYQSLLAQRRRQLKKLDS